MRIYTTTVRDDKTSAVLMYEGEPVICHLHAVTRLFANTFELTKTQAVEVLGALVRKHSIVGVSSLSPAEVGAVNSIITFLYSPEQGDEDFVVLCNVNKGYSMCVMKENHAAAKYLP